MRPVLKSRRRPPGLTRAIVLSATASRSGVRSALRRALLHAMFASPLTRARVPRPVLQLGRRESSAWAIPSLAVHPIVQGPEGSDRDRVRRASQGNAGPPTRASAFFPRVRLNYGGDNSAATATGSKAISGKSRTQSRRRLWPRSPTPVCSPVGRASIDRRVGALEVVRAYARPISTKIFKRSAWRTPLQPPNY